MNLTTMLRTRPRKRVSFSKILDHVLDTQAGFVIGSFYFLLSVIYNTMGDFNNVWWVMFYYSYEALLVIALLFYATRYSNIPSKLMGYGMMVYKAVFIGTCVVGLILGNGTVASLYRYSIDPLPTFAMVILIPIILVMVMAYMNKK